MEQALSQEMLLNFFQEIKDLYRETDRRIKEQSQDTDRKFQETDRKFQDTDRKFQETDRLLKEQSSSLNKKIGKLTNRLGEFIEEMVRPSAVKLFRERGIDVHVVSRHVTAERDGEEAEIDLLVVNDGELIAVECKSNLSLDDVNDHLTRLEKIKRLFPHYREMRLMGAVAAMVLPKQVARYAYKKGLFVLSQSGENMVILNDEKFLPAVW